MIEREAAAAPGPKKLAAWLSGTRHTQTWLAELFDVSCPTVSRWCTGEHSPETHYRRAIEDLTGGEVDMDDWYTDDQLRLAYKFSRSLKRRLERRGVEGESR